MRVAMLGWEMPPKISGGLSRHCYYLAKEMNEQGNEIYFFLPSKNAPEESVVDGIKLVKIDYVENRKNYDEEVDSIVHSYTESLLKKIPKKKFDLIHAHDWMNVSSAIEIRKKLNIPFIYTMHSSEVDRSGGVVIKGSRVLQIERSGLTESDAVITVSRHMRDSLVELFKLGSLGKRINVIYNGINLPSSKHRKPPAVKLGKGAVLFVGRLTEQKGVECLLLAAKKIIEKLPDENFYVVGKGHLKESLEKFAYLLGIEKNVTFFGFVPDENLGDYYDACKLVVVPSLYEPFGVVPLEAMSHKKPLIVSRDAGVSELLKNNVNAVLIDPKNTKQLTQAIIKVLKDGRLASRIAKNGYRLTKGFSWANIAKKTCGLYKKTVKEFGRRR